MKFASQFVVPAAPDKVFALFFDAETMRACVPGCEEMRQIDEETYQGTLVNEVAHVKFKARFSAEIQSVTDVTDVQDTFAVQAILKGEDKRLGSTIKIDARMNVSPHGADSLVSYELEMAMWGKLGRLGEPVIRRRSIEVEKQFATALTAVCAGEPIPESRPKKNRTSPAPAESSEQLGGQGTSFASAASRSPAAAAEHDESRQTRFIVGAVVVAFVVGLLLGTCRKAR